MRMYPGDLQIAFPIAEMSESDINVWVQSMKINISISRNIWNGSVVWFHQRSFMLQNYVT